MTESLDNEVVAEQIACLKEQGFPTALARAMCHQTTRAFPLRLWVVDNSGSMREQDGRRVVGTSSKQHVTTATCSRWEELKDTVVYHAQLAGLLQAPTQFMLLNAPASDSRMFQMGVGEMGPDMVDEELHSLRHTLQVTSPGGVTPLTRHLHNIYALVSSMATSLRQEGKRVVVVLATDGVPTSDTGYTDRDVDRDFENALQRLQGLPVWIVVRLCTNDDAVVKYYQQLDDRLEWNLEVLDDFVDEAKEVHGLNPWLTYALPLHRCREWGFPSRLLDLLDERTLTREEMSDFLQLMFCNGYEVLPDPNVDWEEFAIRVRQLVDREEHPWNPTRRKPTPWIDIRQLERAYGPRRYQRLQSALVGMGGLITIAAMLQALCGATQNISHGLAWKISQVTSSWSDGMSWVLGGVFLLLLVGRNQPLINPRLLLKVLGGVALLVVIALWDKPASYWEGVGWMTGGAVLLLGIAAYND